MKRSRANERCCIKLSVAVKTAIILGAVLCILRPATGLAGTGPEADSTSVEKWFTVKMRVTAYCPCEKCCGEYSDGITASGHKIKPGDVFVAADRRYKMGTEMIIPGYNNSKVVKVLDRGGAIKGNRLDLFFATHQEALNWGVKYLEVKVNLAATDKSGSAK
ncbi:MAG: 3D domain-containing protein [Planctomycetota bacterium]